MTIGVIHVSLFALALRVLCEISIPQPSLGFALKPGFSVLQAQTSRVEGVGSPCLDIGKMVLGFGVVSAQSTRATDILCPELSMSLLL